MRCHGTDHPSPTSPMERTRAVGPQHRTRSRAGSFVPTSCVRMINEALEGWQGEVNHRGCTKGAANPRLHTRLSLGPPVPDTSDGVQALSFQVPMADAVAAVSDPPLLGGFHAYDPR